jgi:hypothetical protein
LPLKFDFTESHQLLMEEPTPACWTFLSGARLGAGALGASSWLLRDAKTDVGGVIAQDGNAKQITARAASRTIPFLPEWLALAAKACDESRHHGLRLDNAIYFTAPRILRRA